MPRYRTKARGQGSLGAHRPTDHRSPHSQGRGGTRHRRPGQRDGRRLPRPPRRRRTAGQIATKARDSFAVAGHLGGPVAGSANSAFVDGIHVALYVAAGIALGTALAVAALPPATTTPSKTMQPGTRVRRGQRYERPGRLLRGSAQSRDHHHLRQPWLERAAAAARLPERLPLHPRPARRRRDRHRTATPRRQDVRRWSTCTPRPAPATRWAT